MATGPTPQTPRPAPPRPPQPTPSQAAPPPSQAAPPPPPPVGSGQCLEERANWQHRLMATTIDCTLILASVAIAHLPLMVLRSFIPAFANSFISLLIVISAGFALLLKDGPIDMGALCDFRSPGKKAMNLRVVTATGRTMIGFMASIHRNSIFAVPIICTLISQTMFMLPMGPLAGLRNWVTVLLAFIGLVAGLGSIAYETFNIIKDQSGQRWGDKAAETVVIAD